MGLQAHKCVMEHSSGVWSSNRESERQTKPLIHEQSVSSGRQTAATVESHTSWCGLTRRPVQGKTRCASPVMYVSYWKRSDKKSGMDLVAPVRSAIARIAQQGSGRTEWGQDCWHFRSLLMGLLYGWQVRGAQERHTSTQCLMSHSAMLGAVISCSTKSCHRTPKARQPSPGPCPLPCPCPLTTPVAPPHPPPLPNKLPRLCCLPVMYSFLNAPSCVMIRP